MCLEQYDSTQVKCCSMRSCAPGLYLVPARKHHDQQDEGLKINPAAKEKQSAVAE